MINIKVYWDIGELCQIENINDNITILDTIRQINLIKPECYSFNSLYDHNYEIINEELTLQEAGIKNDYFVHAKTISNETLQNFRIQWKNVTFRAVTLGGESIILTLNENTLVSDVIIQIKNISDLTSNLFKTNILFNHRTNNILNKKNTLKEAHVINKDTILAIEANYNILHNAKINEQDILE